MPTLLTPPRVPLCGSQRLRFMLLSLVVGTAAASQRAAPSCTASIMNHTHFGKIGYKDLKGATLDACCSACEADQACGGFTLQNVDDAEKRVCHLKTHDTGGSAPESTAVSGVIPGRGPPPPTPIKPASCPGGCKNVLFIISDDMRPSIGAYGLKEAVTPHLDQLAKEGVMFTRAHIQFSYCAPSRNSLCDPIFATHSLCACAGMY